MALSWWKKGLWQIVMHHWTVHAKVEFQKFSCWVRGVHSTTLILNWEMKDLHWYPAILSALQSSAFSIQKNSKLTFSNGPQLMEKRFMANCHASLDSTCKSRISKLSHVGSGGSIPQLLILNWEMKDLHWYLLSWQY